MARYKPYDLKQSKMIPLCYADQLLVGSFEHALNEIVEDHLDMSIFDRRYRNDETGRMAYDPRILLKIVLYGYSAERPMDRMRKKFDSPEGRRIYSLRLGTVEPVFANIQGKGMTRFTLRGKKKVDTQWKLYTLVHNIEKIAHYGKKAA